MKLKIKFTSDLAREIYNKREKPFAWVYGDSGLDLSYVGDAPIVMPAGGISKFPTGIHAQIAGADSENYETQIRGRSGLKSKGILCTVGTIDFTYTGEYGVILYNASNADFTVNPGDRIGQLVAAPIIKPQIEFVTELDATNRGANGFGSTGIK